MPRWFPLSGSSVVHFYQAGDSQAEERFELNTKAGAEERRGAEDSSKVKEDDDENLQVHSQISNPSIHPTFQSLSD